MIQSKVDSVLFDETSGMGIVLIQELNGERVLPIWIGVSEAQSILFKLKNNYSPRPLTHDLLKNCIELLNGEVKYISINKIVHNTFYAEITLICNGREIKVDSRPSDAISLAVRCNSLIYVSEELFAANGIKKSDFMKLYREKLYRHILQEAKNDPFTDIRH